jgi:glucose-6-phosphate isomerase
VVKFRRNKIERRYEMTDFELLLKGVCPGAEETDMTQAEKAFEMLTGKTGAGAEFTGWVDLPINYDKDEFARIKTAARKIRNDSGVLVVCGVGGSYLGPAAAVNFLKGGRANLKSALKGDGQLQIYFVGNNFAPAYINDIISMIGEKDFSVNVISKSGKTMETAVAFRIFRKLLEDKYGREGAANRIYATTDPTSGFLMTEADREGYEMFIIPDDVGGRYSVLTAVGLLPIAAAGCDIDALMSGASDMRKCILDKKYTSAAVEYAVFRQRLYREGKKIEIFANYDPDLVGIGEWLKQLFGESEGKEGQGIFPAAVTLTNDLHSMGQMIQEGERNMFETVIDVKAPVSDICLPAFENDFDDLKYLEGLPVSMINSAAVEGVRDAHLTGGVPQVRVSIPARDEHSLGGLFYFFEFACGISAYIQGVNPFNQPGVEEYKKNIKVLLAKHKLKK